MHKAVLDHISKFSLSERIKLPEGWDDKETKVKDPKWTMEYTEDTTKIRTWQLFIISTGSKNGGCLTSYFCKNTFSSPMIRISSSCTWKWIEYLVGDSRGLHLATIFELVCCGMDCSADNERSNDVSDTSPNFR